MSNILEEITNKIAALNPLHVKKIRRNIKKADDNYFLRAEAFLKKYNQFLFNNKKSLDYGIDCYLKMIADINYETVQFAESGKYSSTSFDEVNKRVYNNPEVMEYYMHGLLLSQFLWKHHYDIMLFFIEMIKKNKEKIGSYLEIGGGHGLYISEAATILGSHVKYEMVDISKSSLDLAKNLVDDKSINYTHSDIFDLSENKKYDFITMGEVLEHVEEPIKLLQKLNQLLNSNGRVFITTPTNAPTIDHIYLFKNAEEIRTVIKEANFEIKDELCVYSEDLPPEVAEKYKVSMMYGACLKKKK